MRTIISAALGAALLSACSFSGQIGTHAIAYNETVEAAENEMLLKNIVRASQHYPMQFTRIAGISGSLSGSATGSVAAPFGSDAQNLASPSLELSGSSTPTFDIQIFNTKEFFNAFLSPISADLFRIYHQTGWSAEHLMDALVEEIWLFFYMAPGQPVTCRVIGNPDGDFATPEGRYERDKMQVLGRLLDHIRDYDIVDRFPIGKPVPVKSAKDIESIMNLQKRGVGLAPPPVGADGKADWSAGAQLTIPTGSGTTIITSIGANVDFRIAARRALSGAAPIFCGDKVFRFLERTLAEDRERIERFAARAELRSTQGIFFALGEMVRLGDKNPKEAAKFDFFRIQRGGTVPAYAIRTTFNGETYWIPPGPEGETSRSLLALARQIFSLNTSSEDAPSTDTVRFIVN